MKKIYKGLIHFFILVVLGSCSNIERIEESGFVTEFEEESYDSKRSPSAVATTSGEEDCGLGNINVGLGKLRQLYRKERKSSQYWISIGNCYLKIKNYSAAEFFYLKAISLNKKSGYAINNIGIVEILKGNYDFALTHFKEASNYGVDVARFNQSLLYLFFGLPDKSIKKAKNLSESFDQDPLFLAKAMGFYLKGEYETAVNLMEKVEEKKYEKPEFGIFYSWILLLSKNKKKSSIIYDKIKINASHPAYKMYYEIKRFL